MSSPTDAPESSRAREQAQPESSTRSRKAQPESSTRASEAQPESSTRAREQEEREGRDDDDDDAPAPSEWVALARVAVILGPDDKQSTPFALAPGTGRGPGAAADLQLDVAPPPRVSYLLLPGRITADAEAYILSACACSSRLLLMAKRGGSATTYDFFLADCQARAVERLPVVPFPLRFDVGVDIVPGRTVGLIADPRNAGHHMVFQLHPTHASRHDTLLCYSSAAMRWTAKPLATTPDHGPWDANGVLAHDGLLWWVDLAKGMLVCDPFPDYPNLRLVPLPPNCQMPRSQPPRNVMEFKDRHRFIRPSQGKLRYVQIVGDAYEMFTLVNPAGPADHWRHEYTVSFADIWGHPSYTDAGLTTGLVPSLALLDPNNADVVYFYLGTSLFGVDGLAVRVLGCQEFLVESTEWDTFACAPCFIDAWELPPTLLAHDTPSGGGTASGKEGPDDDVEELASLRAREEQPESLRAREVQPESPPADEEQPKESSDEPRPWVALSCMAVVLGGDDERAALLAPGAGDLQLDLVPPLRASYLVLPEPITADSRTTIVAACSSRLLLVAARANSSTTYDHFLGDAHARTVTRLPVVPFPIRFDVGVDLAPRRSIGLIADRHHPGHHMLLQLHPIDTNRHDTLLCYSTAAHRWTVKVLATTLDHGPWRGDGVLAHDGLLWWIDISKGMLVCDPFPDYPDLRFVPLPPTPACRTPRRLPPRRGTMLNDQHRFIRPSQGKLRYVQIVGEAYDMFTLVNPEGPKHHWTREYTVNFADIWSHPSYTAAGLNKGLVPSLALVDPNNAFVVYFFLGTSIFAVDGRTRCILGCQEYLVHPTQTDVKPECCCFIDAWELPPTLLGDDASSYVGCGREGPDDDQVKMDVAEASDSEELESLLSKMKIKSQPDITPSSELLSKLLGHRKLTEV